ncbi:hypothetical protein CVT26_003298 [Gymnopilus dilepis]|uniref:F-box domain-containing protein n=1 Tax=Gymnopilus dilepis TaxID=231916 RepID=A0A409Y4Z9_9AGAR|nr:hypothetical protein CVT26_003298 [Gymnopilus dilepis]
MALRITSDKGHVEGTVGFQAKEQLLTSGHLQVRAHKAKSQFLTLPLNLYLEILSHFPVLPVPSEDSRQYDAAIFLSRKSTLFALCKTCRCLRSVFRKHLYQRVEVYDGMLTGNGPLPSIQDLESSKPRDFLDRKYTVELVRQLETVTIRDPALAQYVNTLNVTIVDRSPLNILVELARCIALLPNLYTVQLLFTTPSAINVASIFKKYQPYRQIRNICVAWQGIPFLAACPNAQRIAPYQGKSYQGFLSQIILSCQHVKRLGYILFEPETPERISNSLIDLDDITLDYSAFLRGYRYLSPLSTLYLQTIRIISLPRSEDSVRDKQDQEWISLSARLLRACPKNDSTKQEKRVLLYHLGSCVHQFIVH